MLPEKEDKTISNEFQDISITADERPNRRKGTKGTKGSDAQPPKKIADSTKGKGSAGILVWLICLVLVGIAGFHFWQIDTLQDSLGQTRTELTAAKQLLSQVTGDISATGENVSQNESALRKELEVINSEIRKLWDVSNKRNKQSISNNEKSIDQLNKQLVSATTTANSAQSVAQKAVSQLADLEKLVKAAMSEQVSSRTVVSASMAQLKDQLNQLQTLLNKQKQGETGLQKSLDDYRTQVNRKLLQLETSVRELASTKKQGL
ncbi:hypothetical protein [Candidatus Sororendozoicomonas aggregata]|uniref:hypothetical protein n=1 Tax=Candidatus Sororendozoicomonas aggregata TaxID=3073239 RepID=UPI002ED3EB0F